MADERHYIVQLEAEGFDGTTPATLDDSWLPAPKNQSDQKYRSLSLAEGSVGLFPPGVLGGAVKGTRLVRVFTDGAITEGDRYWTVGSAVEVAADGLVEADPVSVVRETSVPLTTRPSGAQPLELGPTDQLAIFTTRATTAHIVVVDLDEDEIYDWSARLADRSALTRQVTSRAIAAATTVATWQGLLFLAVTAAAAADTLTLPPIALIAEGDEVVIYNDSALWFQVDADSAETINGSTNTVRVLGNQGVIFKRTAFGWSASGTAHTPALTAVAGSSVLTAWREQRRTIAWTPAGAPNILTLPAISTVALGQELVVYLTAQNTLRSFIIPATGERINGIVDDAIHAGLVNAGDCVLLLRVPNGWAAIDLTQTFDRSVSTAVLDPLGAQSPWRGLRVQPCTYAAGPGNYTLPPSTGLMAGCQLLIWQTNANTITLQGNGNTITAGGTSAATKALTQNVPVLLTFDPNYGWIGT